MPNPLQGRPVEGASSAGESTQLNHYQQDALEANVPADLALLFTNDW